MADCLQSSCTDQPMCPMVTQVITAKQLELIENCTSWHTWERQLTLGRHGRSRRRHGALDCHNSRDMETLAAAMAPPARACSPSALGPSGCSYPIGAGARASCRCRYSDRAGDRVTLVLESYPAFQHHLDFAWCGSSLLQASCWCT